MNLKRTSIILSEELVERIEDWRMQHSIRSRNQAILDLLERALDNQVESKTSLSKTEGKVNAI